MTCDLVCKPLFISEPQYWCPWCTGQALTRRSPARPQDRPCQRCIKRNIGHLCHDEPRDSPSNLKKAKSVLETSTVADESESQSDLRQGSRELPAGSMGPPSSFDSSGLDAAPGPGQAPKTSFDASALGRGNPLQLVQPTPVSGIQANANALTSNMNQCRSPLAPCAVQHVHRTDQAAELPSNWILGQLDADSKSLPRHA